MDDSQFTPHGFCLAWQPGLLWITVIAHAMTAYAYFGIPFMLALSMKSLAVIPHWLLALFGVFILLCGVSHVLEILAIWIPDYWWIAIEVGLTGLVSLLTLFLLPAGIEQILHRARE
jgi:two-component system, NtrC family, sensor kinase